MRHRTGSKLLAVMLALALLAAQASAASRAPELPNPGNAGISRDDQMELCFQAAARYAFHRNHMSEKSATRKLEEFL